MASSHDDLHPLEGGIVDADDLSGEIVPWGVLVIATGASAGRVFSLTNAEVVIGRSRTAQICLSDKPISSNHAKIVRGSSGCHLVDLGSSNGTFLNGQRLKSGEPAELALGDSIQVAETVMAYRSGSASAQDQTQHLSRLAPQFPETSALMLPEARALAQLLQTSALTTQSTESGASLEDQLEKLLKLWALVRRHWVPVVALAVAGALIGDVSVFVRPPASEATVRIRMSAKKPDNPLQRERYEPEDDQFYEEAQQAFVSAPVASVTLKRVRETPNQWRLAAALSSLRIERIGPGLYQGIFTHRDPEYAVNFLNHHVQVFLDQEISKKIKVVQAQVEFLRTQLNERDAELRRTELALRAFKDRHADGLPEFASGHFANREELHMKRAEISARLSRSNLELQAARKRLQAESPMAVRKVTSAAPYEQALVEVKRKLTEAKGKGLGDAHPEVVALNKQSAELTQLAEQARNSTPTELERTADPGLQQLSNRVADLEVEVKGGGAELGELNSELSRLDSFVTKMPEVEAEYAQLTRSYAASKEVHSRLFGQLKSSELDLELQRTSAKAQYEVVSATQSTGVPMRRTLVIRSAIGVAAGLVLGILVALLREAREFVRAYKRRRVSIVRVSGDPR